MDISTQIIELIVTMVSIAVSAVVFIDFAGIAEKFKKKLYYIRYSKQSPYKPYTLKPFDCAPCMSFWLAVILLWTPTIWMIPIASATAYIAIVLRRILY